MATTSSAPSRQIYTIGHSTRPFAEFLTLLRTFGVNQLVDIRTIAGSRHNPQYGKEALASSLPAAGIGYRHATGLGGLRKTHADSPNGAWHNASFRGYADYMQTPEFAAALADLIELARSQCVAIMCAEAVPWRCHRSLVGDALVVRGFRVDDIMSRTKLHRHTLTRF
ncbi:MAG: DUF488 domain-containing protein, partial [Bowdeniella nasicola]|nr:DUF488 domain-containing protein [Bowdeniella nasicola]